MPNPDSNSEIHQLAVSSKPLASMSPRPGLIFSHARQPYNGPAAEIAQIEEPRSCAILLKTSLLTKHNAVSQGGVLLSSDVVGTWTSPAMQANTRVGRNEGMERMVEDRLGMQCAQNNERN